MRIRTKNGNESLRYVTAPLARASPQWSDAYSYTSLIRTPNLQWRRGRLLDLGGRQERARMGAQQPQLPPQPQCHRLHLHSSLLCLPKEEIQKHLLRDQKVCYHITNSCLPNSRVQHKAKVFEQKQARHQRVEERFRVYHYN